jgi:hypothetical protein
MLAQLTLTHWVEFIYKCDKLWLCILYVDWNHFTVSMWLYLISTLTCIIHKVNSIKTKFKACIQLHTIKIPDSLKLWKESLNSDEKQLNYIQRNEQLPLISSQVLEK